MDTETVMNILRNIGTYKPENGEEQSDLYGNFEGRDYTVEELADMISTLDVSTLKNDDKDYLDNLNRRLTNDNMSDNKYKNEDVLLGPLSKKIDEYNYVIKNEDFKSNAQTLENLKSRNQNLSSLNMIDLKPYQTDSNLSLDYVTVRRPDGHAEMIPISDPDYLDRFVDEHADDIGEMSDDELYNTLKNSTESELQYVDINKYLTDETVRNHMPQPKMHDEQMIGYEIDEVRRLVNQFIPGTPIEISIDKNGEIFYRANDAIFKGISKEGKREVTCLQQPGLIENYDHNVATGAMSSEEVNDAVNKDQNGVITESKAVDTDRFTKPVPLEPPLFIDLMKDRENILNGDDQDKINLLLDQLNAAIETRNEETLFSGVQKVVTDYLNWRYQDYLAMQKGDVSTYGKPLSSREVGILEKLKNKDSLIDYNKAKELYAKKNASEARQLMNDSELQSKMKEQDSEEKTEEDETLNYFEFDGEEQVENVNENEIDNVSYDDIPNNDFVNVNDMEQSAPVQTNVMGKTRSLSKNKKGAFNHGLSMLVILIEIATVALIVMMFLSLDI